MSTPPLSRSNSRGSLDGSSSSETEELEKKDSKRTADSSSKDDTSTKAPSTSNRGLKRTGTWSNGYMPKDKKQVGSTDPLLSPRSTKAKLPTPPSSSNVAPSSSNLPTPSTSTRPGSEAASAKKNEDKSILAWKNLPEKIKATINAGLQHEGILSGKALGRLLITIESAVGVKKPESKAGGSPILRGTQVITGVGADDEGKIPGKTIKVMESFLAPFLKQHLNTEALEQVRKKVQRNYDSVVSKLARYGTGSLRPKQVLEIDGYKEIMNEVIKPLTDYLLGETFNQKASGLTMQMKELLQTIDAEMVNWINDQGPADLDEQYLLRRSALVAILAIRGIGPEWKTKFSQVEADEGYSDMHFLRLNVYYNAFLTHKLDSVYAAIMLKTEGQHADIKILLKSKAPRERQKLASVLSPRAKNTGVLDKLGKIFSSSGTERPVVPSSPRDASVMAKSLKESDTRKTNVERKRAAALNDMTRNLRLADFSPQFMKLLKAKVTGSREEFRKFKAGPASYCLEQLNEFVQSLDEKQVPANADKYRAMLASLASDEGKKQEKSDAPILAAPPQPAIARITTPVALPALPKAPAVSTSGGNTVSGRPAVSLDLSKLRKSPFEGESTSSATEPSDSTEIESEQSTEDKSQQ